MSLPRMHCHILTYLWENIASYPDIKYRNIFGWLEIDVNFSTTKIDHPVEMVYFINILFWVNVLMQESMSAHEVESAIHTDSRHSDRLRAVYASKETAECGYVTFRRIEFLGSRKSFEMLKRVSGDNNSNVYELLLRAWYHFTKCWKLLPCILMQSSPRYRVPRDYKNEPKRRDKKKDNYIYILLGVIESFDF